MKRRRVKEAKVRTGATCRKTGINQIVPKFFDVAPKLPDRAGVVILSIVSSEYFPMADVAAFES
jgi:hypothetical protein